MRADLSVIGPQATLPRRIAASATRFDYGEPLIQAAATFSSGAASENVFTVAATDVGIIGTDNFSQVSYDCHARGDSRNLSILSIFKIDII